MYMYMYIMICMYVFSCVKRVSSCVDANFRMILSPFNPFTSRRFFFPFYPLMLHIPCRLDFTITCTYRIVYCYFLFV